MFEKLKQEPVIFMTIKMWEFAGDQRPRILLMWFLSLCGRLVWLLPPAVFAYLLNEIQKNGATENNLYFLVGILVSIFALSVGGWLFHAPSRIMERSIGYKVDRYFKKYLYNAVFYLPLTWHTDHDSGDTIDKINKATDSMFQFFVEHLLS